MKVKEISDTDRSLLQTNLYQNTSSLCNSAIDRVPVYSGTTRTLNVGLEPMTLRLGVSCSTN